MKKVRIILLVCLCSLVTNFSLSQDLHWDASGGYKQQKFGPSMRGFYYGPVAGINVSTITQMSYAKARVRPLLGLMVGYQISNIIGVQAEALYSWQGANMSNSDLKNTFNYLKIPILAKFNIISGLGIEAGVSFEPLIYSSVDNGSHSMQEYVKDFSHKMDFTIPVGITFLIARRYELGARYYIPCVKIYQDQSSSFNSVFSFTLKYRF